MNTLEEKIKDYWNHIDLGAIYQKKPEKAEFMRRHYEKIVGSRVNVHDKTVIDFGCGDGLLGLHLFMEHGLDRYIGYDISITNIKSAMKSLKEFPAWFVVSDMGRNDFASKKPDIFISLACAIHFPDRRYLDGWLEDVNMSGAGELIIEIRDTGKGTKFHDIPCIKPWGSRIVCLTNEAYVSEHLSGYCLMKKTDPEQDVINCQILYYKKGAA